MKIERLVVGKSFKNYKALCTELGLEIKNSTNSKNAQIKELNRFCKISKQGHSFVIDEVYSNPLDKIDNRKLNNSIYGDLIQLLITDLLAKSSGHISLSRGRLMSTIGMVNPNYGGCREYVRKLSKYMSMDEKYIYDFYNTSSSNFKNTIETALNNLMDKRVIMYGTILKVKENKVVRIALPHEINGIMKVEKDTLTKLGYQTMSNIRVSKDWKLFQTLTNKLLKETLHIDYYYSAYDITINDEYIEQERDEQLVSILDKIKRQESMSQLNQIIIENTLINAKNRHEKESKSVKMNHIRKSDDYVDNFSRLTDLLIQQNALNVIDDVMDIKLDELSAEQDNEITELFA